MNYLNHYNVLINRAKNRVSAGYVESHHIIPRCLGGSDDAINLVNLTPEEHFVAHQLLVKINPSNKKILHAAIMMTVGSNRIKRNNKLYGWLRRSLPASVSGRQRGPQNSQYGKTWIYNRETYKSLKVNANDLQEYLNNGWHTGRAIKRVDLVCPVCNTLFRSSKGINTCSRECYKKTHPMYSVLLNRDMEFLEKYKKLGSIALTRRDMKYDGSTDYFYQWAHSILKQGCSSTDRINESESLDVSSILTNPTIITIRK